MARGQGEKTEGIGYSRDAGKRKLKEQATKQSGLGEVPR